MRFELSGLLSAMPAALARVSIEQGIPFEVARMQVQTSPAYGQLRTCAAAMTISSRMRVVRLMMAPSPMPGNTCAVCAMLARIRRPSASCTLWSAERACRRGVQRLG
jgi:hypothetical protein